MGVEEISPRAAAAVGLLALVPTLVFGVSYPGIAGYVAAVNVVLIFAALYVAMAPIEDADHGKNSGTAT
ncbi:hypothetical protein [Natronobacterium gregoryi]|uniref:Cytochrome-ba3 oxidase subunit n=2 Tax=Natronobacterium gregoryi TaxID=44930 RepID=L0AIX3_NATGS|nr:hypothetical protein [Natronobacterium gregoryi]AFZ73015.1 hypothetical protein Natgr_1824 [Natronobacterium gregoryi SP2]ELY64870.1 cytochrome-ba3 oxidase subunit [Natronobacterium gregoryi SP2]PLK18375.1 cytochrome-ba3 oxidase subunit [Natronobacterium gregoryi SP2]SFJ71581.1 hypothetical protein SAMN05443661_1648 [Natronobacterium gregoryi]